MYLCHHRSINLDNFYSRDFKMPPRPVSGSDSLDEAVDNFHHVATVLRGVTSSSYNDDSTIHTRIILQQVR